MNPYRAGRSSIFRSVFIERRGPMVPALLVLVFALGCSTSYLAGRSHAVTHAPGDWTLNAEGTDLVYRGPHGREVFRLREADSVPGGVGADGVFQ